MAKKGGVSEINGFVSVKNEDPKTSSKKVVARGVSESNQKTSSSIKKASGKPLADSQELKKSTKVDLKPKAAVKDDRKPLLSSTTKQQSSKTQIIKDTKVQNPSKTNGPSKVSRTVASEPARNTLKSKTSEATSKTISMPRKLESKTKSLDPNKQRKDMSPREDVTDKKLEQKIFVNPSSVKPTKTGSINKAVDSKPKKIVDLKSTKNEARKKEDLKTSVSSPKANVKSSVVSKKIVSSRGNNNGATSVSSPKAVTKSEVNSKKPASSKEKNGVNSLISSSETSAKLRASSKKPGSSEEKNNFAKITITSKETSRITIKEPENASNKRKVPLEEINIKTISKDSVYFEVDLGEKKEPPKAVPPSPLPPPISRQGTFTKNDEDSAENSLTLPVITHAEPPSQPEDQEYDYEDDFEDYESDFEEYLSESGVSSNSESEFSKEDKPVPVQEESGHSTPKPPEKTVEEEKKLDSGSYDLSTKSVNFVMPHSVKQKQLDQIKEAISRENSLYSEREKDTAEVLVENDERDILNFVDALKRQGAESTKKEKKNRSALILEKIKLHIQQISIFEGDFFYIEDIDPLYSNRNVAHVGTDAAILSRNEDTQTDDIKTKEKWIQFPPAFHKRDGSKNPLELYCEDQRGFGGDNVEVDLTRWVNPYYNPEKLYNFVEAAGQVILIMLEEEARWRSDGSISVMKAKHDHGFSRGFIPIQTKNLEFLKNRPICDIVFSPHNQHLFLSSHRFIKDIENYSFEEQLMGRSIICLWSILEPSQPLSIFVASCQISAIAFDIAHNNLLYGGLTDGSVCLWDTSERSIFHKETIAGVVEHLLRTPSFCSSYLLDEDLHNNVIVAVQSLGYGYSENYSPGKFVPPEVLTLDCDGKIIVWVTVSTASNMGKDYAVEKEDFGQTFWSEYKLVASRALNPSVNLPSTQNAWSLQFLCMTSAPQATRSVLVGTNTGSVVHCLLSEEKAAVPVYSNKEETDCMTSVLSLEKSPHQFPVFLAGCSNGTVRIHVMERRRPVRILIMESQFRGSPVTKIKWSHLGAGLFFALDKNLSLHLWDLCKGISSPLVSLPMKKLKATHFDISSDNKFVYLGLVVHKERLEIHRLKEQFTPEVQINNEKDKEIFSSIIEKCFY